MRKLFNECKKGGFRGLYARREFKIVGFAMFMLLAIGMLCMASGSDVGTAVGMSFAVAPIVAFKMPDDVELTENEQKAISKIMGPFAESINKAIQENAMTDKQLVDKMKETLKELGVENDTIKKLDEVLKKQGSAITKLQEDPLRGKTSSLKSVFDEKFDELQKAVKEGVSGFEIKAASEGDVDLLHATNNGTITGLNGARVIEQSGEDTNLYMKRRPRQYIRDIASVTRVPSVPEDFSFWEEGSEDGTVAIVAENGLKPQVQLKLVKNRVEKKKVAAWIWVTEEMVKFRQRAWGHIQRLFRDKFMREYDNILTTELTTNATSYISTPLDGTIANPTDFTALVAAILQMESLDFSPDTLVINPADKWRLALTETTSGFFILPYIQQGGQFGLLGLRVITTNKVAAGKFYIGESRTWNIEEESPTLRTGLINDDFIHNRFVLLMETFFLSYVPSNNAGSWIYGDFADIKEALQAPVEGQG